VGNGVESVLEKIFEKELAVVGKAGSFSARFGRWPEVVSGSNARV
jgi:hypothetical protein